MDGRTGTPSARVRSVHAFAICVHGVFADWSVVPSVLNVVDKGLANITAKLRQQDMWGDTLLVLTSDNGGDCERPGSFGDLYGPLGPPPNRDIYGPANNYP